jgi:hypothetical protein
MANRIYKSLYGAIDKHGQLSQFQLVHPWLCKVCCLPGRSALFEEGNVSTWIHPLGTWDLNFDGKIDAKDIGRAGKAFGSLPGSSRWDIEADVNLDGKIDAKDIGAICKKFGKSVSPWPPDP